MAPKRLRRPCGVPCRGPGPPGPGRGPPPPAPDRPPGRRPRPRGGAVVRVCGGPPGGPAGCRLRARCRAGDGGSHGEPDGLVQRDGERDEQLNRFGATHAACNAVHQREPVVRRHTLVERVRGCAGERFAIPVADRLAVADADAEPVDELGADNRADV